MLGSVPGPPGPHLPLARAARSPLLCFAPHPAALPRPPRVTRLAWVTSGDSGEPVAVSGHSYSCRPRDPILCPEMLFIPRGGGTDAPPKFGDFSIGAIWTLTPGQEAPEMPYGICCGFYVLTWSPPARTQGCCLQTPGEPWEQAEHPHGGVVKGLGGGRGLTMFNRVPSMCPLPTAALGEPDQHGSAGELCQRRPRHAAEGTRRCPAPAQGRPAASTAPGSTAPGLLQR